MKYSVATVATLAAGVLATPQITNSKFDLEEGEPFEITFSGCEAGCTIVLQNGPSTDLDDVATLTSEATDGSFVWTPEDLPSDTYAFKIYPTGDETDANYSLQFEYEGTGSASSSAATSAASTKATSTSAETTSAETTSAETTSAETTMATSTSAETSSTPSTTSDSMASTTSPATSSTTTPPSAAGTTRYSPIALIAGAVAAIAFLN